MAGYLGSKAVLLSTTAATVTGNATVGGSLTAGSATISGDLTVDTDTLYVDSANNRVGVGTTSPSATLDIEEATGAVAIQLGSNGSGGRDWRLQTGDTASGLAGSLRVYDVTGTAERARIDSSGRLLVGRTADTTSGVGVTVAPSGYVRATVDGGASGVFNRLTSDGSVAIFRKDGITVGTVSVTSSATSYNTSSDYRLKEDWQPMTGASERVLALNPVNFAWKSDGSRVDGFLAHEAQAVVPEAVHGEKDAVDEDGNPVYQGIDQSKLVPLLTAALQEALNKIDDLEARVAALEAKQ